MAALLTVAGCAGEPADPLPLGRSAESCGSCHEEHYEAWRSSPHAASARSPVLEALLPEVERAWGSFARERCVGCHAPEHGEDEGIGCLSCHAATGNRAERDGLLTIDLRAPLSGPFADAEPTIAHRSRPDAFLASASLCGTCHELTGPALVDEPTLREHRASPQAAMGISCADCHMPAGAERPLSNESDRTRPTRSHRFVGFDPPWGAGPDEAARAAEETRILLASALELRLERIEGGVEIVLRNVGAGHAVPTGATVLRDLWVDVELDGVELARVIELGDQPMRDDRPVAILPDADRVERRALDAGAERRVRIDAPPDAVVTATLRARAIRSDTLERLGLAQRASEVPTHEVAVRAL